MPVGVLALEPAFKLGHDRGPVRLRVGEIHDGGEVLCDVKPRGEFVAAVHDVGGAGEVGFVADQVRGVLGGSDAVGGEQRVEDARARGDEVVVAGVEPDAEGAAARLFLGGLEGRRAQKHFSVEQVQHEAGVVAQAVEGRRELFIGEHARVERRLGVVVGMVVENGKHLRRVEDAAECAGDRLEFRLVHDLRGELDRVLNREAGTHVGIVGGEAGVAVLVEADAIAADAGGDYEARVEKRTLRRREQCSDGTADETARYARVDEGVVVSLAVAYDGEVVRALADEVGVEITGYDVVPPENEVRRIFRQRGVADGHAGGIDENLDAGVTERAQLSVFRHAGEFVSAEGFPEIELPREGSAGDIVAGLSTVDHPAAFEVERARVGIRHRGRAAGRIGDDGVRVAGEKDGVVDGRFHPLLRTLAVVGELEGEVRGEPLLDSRDDPVEIRVAPRARAIGADAKRNLRRRHHGQSRAEVGGEVEIVVGALE